MFGDILVCCPIAENTVYTPTVRKASKETSQQPLADRFAASPLRRFAASLL